MEKNFVQFYSPGTMVSEVSTKPIDSWDVQIALDMARTITERHGATPYGFQFITRSRADDELDSSVADRSPMYFLGGDVLTLEQVKARDSREDRILISNMECNGWDRIIENRNSWFITQPLKEHDVVLDWAKP